MTTIYRKTPKGVAEIETRAHRLAPRLRGALILVDGQRSTDDLAKLIAGDAAATLQQLLGEGFIELLAVLDDRPLPPPSGPSAAPPASTVAPIAALQRDAVRYLTDRLGPSAEGIALKIERAADAATLRPLLLQAANLLRSFGGAAAADPFVARFIDPAP